MPFLAMRGYYVEGAYNLLPLSKKQKLDAFVRYENFDTHADTARVVVFGLYILLVYHVLCKR